MNRFSPIYGCVVIVLWATAAALWGDIVTAESPKEISLDQIWALDMPGARRLHELEPSPKSISPEDAVRKLRILQIQRALSYRPKEDQKAGPAFVVAGTGSQALKNAAVVLTKKVKPTEVFPPDTELTLVFFSHRCGRYVWIDSIEQSKNRITVKYRFVSHATRDAWAQFALIPLGKLPRGKIRVEIQQLPPKSLHPNFAKAEPIPNLERVVCDSFSFRVGE